MPQNSKTKFKQTEIGVIPEDWEIKEFSKVLKIKGRIGWKGYTRQDLVDEGPFVIGGKEINSTRYLNLDEAKHLSREKFEESPEIKLKKDDILLVTRGNLGEVGFFDGTINEATINPSLVILSDFIEEPLFLFYYLLSPQGNKNIMGLRSGSSVPAIYQASLKKIKYPSPLISEQKAIAKIFSDLDSKINVLQKQNKTLEEIGHAIFKKWFIDNPGNEGWEEGFLNDNILTELIKPGIDNFKGEKIYIPTANITNSTITNYDYRITYNKRPSRASMQPSADTIWFAKMKESPKIQLFLEGEDWRLNNLILSTGFAGVKPKKGALFYIWNIINSSKFETEKDNLAMGTTMQGINNQNIEKIRYLIPDDKTLSEFEKIVNPFYYKISINHQQIQTLSQIRDSLLPKLMSGKIRVPVK